MKLGQLLALTVLSIFGDAAFAKAYADNQAQVSARRSPTQMPDQRYLHLRLQSYSH